MPSWSAPRPQPSRWASHCPRQPPDGSTASPAAQAGLQPGDVITAIDGSPVTQWDEVTAWIRDHGGQTATLTVERVVDEYQVAVQIATVDRPVVDEQGNLTDQTGATALGVAPDFAYVSQGWAAVPAYIWDITVPVGEGLISLPVRTYGAPSGRT
jgi:membrane-associated protease RseP (regulator of RpoE activity)